MHKLNLVIAATTLALTASTTAMVAWTYAHDNSTSQVLCHAHTEDSCGYAWIHGRPYIVPVTP